VRCSITIKKVKGLKGGRYIKSGGCLIPSQGKV